MAIYQGDEPKFAINITAQGFSMDTDDFDVEIVSTTGGSLKGSKGGTSTDVIIFSETDSSDETPVTTWYVIVDTSKELRPGGSLKVVATAYVPDAHANDGIRKQIVTGILDKFVAP